MSDERITSFFKNKPETHAIFEEIKAVINDVGPSTLTIGKQISFGNERKFAWIWLYNVTSKNPNGILHIMLAIDTKVADPHVRAFNQIGKARWNHQIVVRTIEDAKSSWLKQLIKQAYEYSLKKSTSAA